MRYTEHKFTLDVNQTASQVCISVKKGDTARRLLIHLTESGYEYHLSSECHAVFTAKKPDGHVVFNDCTIDDCVIGYNFTAQTVPVAGLVECEIVLYGSSGEQLTSAGFHMLVEDTIYDTETEVESTNEYNALAALISRVQEMGDRLEEMSEKLLVDWYDLAPAIVDTTEKAATHKIYSSIGWPMNVIVYGKTIQYGEGTPSPDNIRKLSGLGEMDAMRDLDGTETWILTESVDAEKPRFRIAMTGNKVSDLTDGATSFMANLDIPLLAKGETYQCNQGYTISDGIMYVYIDGITTAEDMANYFAENPCKLLYTKKTHTVGNAYYTGICMTDAEGNHGYAVELVRPLLDGDTAEIFTKHDGEHKYVETHIKKQVVLDGTENFVLNYTDASKGLTQYTCSMKLGSMNTDVTNNNGRMACSHYPVGRDIRQVTYPNIWMYAGNTLVLTDTYSTAAELKAYLADQYAAGTPVTIVYKLAEPEVYYHDPVFAVPASMPCQVAAEGFSVASYPHDTKHYIEERAVVRRTYVELPAAKWQFVSDRHYSQEITVSTIKPNSTVDFLFTVDQILVLHDKDVSFTATNSQGTVTAHAVGTKPTMDYTVQARIEEVVFV